MTKTLIICGPTCGCGIAYASDMPKCPNCGKENLGLPKGSTVSQSPAPVAGAVEALPPDVLEALGWLEKLSEPGWYADRLGPLNDWLKAHPLVHPQPAPVVDSRQSFLDDVERKLHTLTERGDERAERLGLRPASAVAVEARDLAPVIAWLEGGCDPKQAAQELRLLAARSAPAVAEKVPLTDDQILTLACRAADKCHGFTGRALYVAREVERAHGIGSCSAQEGQANG